MEMCVEVSLCTSCRCTPITDVKPVVFRLSNNHDVFKIIKNKIGLDRCVFT